MSDSLLPYYNRELNAIRRLAAEFAAANPKIAGRLRLSADAVDDPHVERLLEGAAFLAARVHHRLDDEFPELTDALLSVLYPHYLTPVPSCAIAQFSCQPQLAAPVRIPPGLVLDTEPVRGEPCRFRTALPLTLCPLEVESVRLSALPFPAPANPLARGAASVLRVVVRCCSPELSLGKLGLDRLQFFLRGPADVALSLYELLCAHALSVAYAEGSADPAPAIFPPDAIEPAGFAPEEGLLPWPARSFTGFRLLTEYFALPQKFLFVDFTGIQAKALRSDSNRIEIFVYLDRSLPELERSIGTDSVALGCTPIVNLFPQRCEPIPLTHTDTEYRVVADARRLTGLEIWSVERVRQTSGDGTARGWRPFYRLTHAEPESEPACGYYHVVRRHSPEGLPGTECFIAPHDIMFDPNEAHDSVLSVDALCLNCDLPSELPFGGGHPALTLAEPSPVIQRIACLTAPTPTLRPALRQAGFWPLVSHLSLSHLSVVGGEEGADALREVLRLYDLKNTAESRAAIAALLSVSSSPGVARLPGSRAGAFCRGIDVVLEFDPAMWQTGGLYLLASVLDRFLGLHATLNSFVRTTVMLRGRPDRAGAWPARAGARVLL